MKLRSLLWLSYVTALFVGCSPEAVSLNTTAPEYGFPSQLDQGPTSQDSPDLSSNAQAGDTPESDWPSVSGVWRIDHRTTLRSELPVILQEVETVIDAVLIAEVTQEEGDLWLHYQVCDVRMVNTPAFNHTILPDSFLEALPYRTRRAQLVRRDGGQRDEGWWLEVPKQYELRGMTMERPESETLPLDSEDARVFDQDRDGAPGLTARLVGFPEGEVNLIQRSWDIWRGALSFEVVEPERADRLTISSIEGSIEWGDEQRIIEASREVLTVDVRRWIPMDPSLHRFQMRRTDQLECPPRQAPPVPER